ncbi:hypothetical protein ABT023_03830 [Micromonospora sp. NPDC002296]|uniref:hypothetical protein n=1 Tax=Micromonospora sp. NPDC002296 TaxID=3154271 RepID=UPI00331C80BA
MSREPTSIADAATAAAPVRQRSGADPAPPRPADGATSWTEYVAAARQLDGVRRSAATAATEQARAVRAAREELTAVRERLAPQRSRLRELGVPPMVLVPSPPELTEAARSMVGGPTAVLGTLRSARGWADAADGVLAARSPLRPAAWPPKVRNLLVYGPLALVVPLLQVVLYLATGTGPASVVALICGVPMPAAAFVTGWLAVGRLFDGPTGPAAAGEATRRTPSPGTPGGPTESAPAVPVVAGSRRRVDPTGVTLAAVRASGGRIGGGGAVGDPTAMTLGAVPNPTTGGRSDRTPRWGALVCLVPAVSTTAGLVLAMLAG